MSEAYADSTGKMNPSPLAINIKYERLVIFIARRVPYLPFMVASLTEPFIRGVASTETDFYLTKF